MQYGLAQWIGYKFLTRYARLAMVPDDPAGKDEFTDLNATQVIRDAITDEEHIPDVGAIMGGGASEDEDFSDELAQLAAMVDNMPAPSSSAPPAFEDDLAGLEVIQAPEFPAAQASPAPAAPPATSQLPEVPDEIVDEIAKVSLLQRLFGWLPFLRRGQSADAAAGTDTLPSVDSIASLDDDGEEYRPPWYLRKGIIIGLGLLALLLLSGLSFFIVNLFLGDDKHKPAPPETTTAHAPATAQRSAHNAAHAATQASGTATAASGSATLEQQYQALLKKNQALEAENKQLKDGSTASAAATQPTGGQSGVIGSGDQKGMDCQLVGGNAGNSLKNCIEQFNQQDDGRK